MRNIIGRVTFLTLFILVTVFCLSAINYLYAGADSFQISPAPVPYPKYEEGRKDLKITGVFASMSGSGLSLTGGGFNLGGRIVPTPPPGVDFKGAVSGAFGLFVLGGEYTSSAIELDMTLVSMNPQFAIEYQFIKKDLYSLIGFGGFSLPMFSSSIDGSAISVSSFGIMYGIPFGVQGGIYPHPDWTIVPFVFINWILGGGVTVNTTVYSGGRSTYNSTSESIDGHMSTSFGADVVYEPYNISLGSLLQNSDGGGTAGSIKTTILQMSWKKTF